MANRSTSLAVPAPGEFAPQGTVAVIGAGGNIGSHVVSHIARLPGVSSVMLIDNQRYTSDNLRSQEITSRDVGRAKAGVQADRLRRIRPDLDVSALVAPVQEVPLGILQADVTLSCLDSLAARQWIAEACWRLSQPLVDAGVSGGSLLARVHVYRPGPENACYECGWDSRHYAEAASEQTHPCQAASGTAPAQPAPTNAPSFLGGLAASLMAAECMKILGGEWDQVLVGSQVLIDVRNHTHYRTRYPRNPACRFDHRAWEIESLDADPSRLTLADALRLGRTFPGANGAPRLRPFLQSFVTLRVCSRCNRMKRGASLDRRTGASPRCRFCKEALLIASVMDSLSAYDVPGAWLDLPLSRLGFRPFDVFTVGTPGRETRWQLAGGRSVCASVVEGGASVDGVSRSDAWRSHQSVMKERCNNERS